MKEYERDPDYDPDNIDMNAGCSSTINIVFGILFYIIGGIPLLMQLWKWFLNINKWSDLNTHGNNAISWQY